MEQRIDKQLIGRVARTDGVKPDAFFANKTQVQKKDETIRITIKNTTLNIEQGEFDGDVGRAQDAIQSFVNENLVVYTSFRGHGTLLINNTQHAINPYGIDIPMMLKFCNISVASLASLLDM